MENFRRAPQVKIMEKNSETNYFSKTELEKLKRWEN